MFHTLVINPGSTSTKVAVFMNEEKVLQKTIRHSAGELAPFENILEQTAFRKELVLSTLLEAGMEPVNLKAVVGRGGLLQPIPSGTYQVTDQMLTDLKAAKRGTHASNLGALIAHDISQEYGIPAYIVDPVCVDEMHDLARLSGLAELPRESLFHALNQKAIARRTADDLHQPYEALNLIIAHLGGGITVGAHRKGCVVDVNNAVGGEGAYSPERSGGIPVGGLVRMCFSGQYTETQIMKKLVGSGGLVSYLGTNDAMEVEKRIDQGDKDALHIFEGMAYQVSKEIGAAATVLKGKVDAISITGGLAHSGRLVQWISDRVKFIAQVKVYPGEDEMEALAAGCLRVLLGQEQAKIYYGGCGL